jgi:hypothetical protein
VGWLAYITMARSTSTVRVEPSKKTTSSTRHTTGEANDSVNNVNPCCTAKPSQGICRCSWRCW